MDSIEIVRAKTRSRLDERRNAIIMGLAPQLTPEFLKTLAEVTRAIGIEGERRGPLLEVAEVFRVAGVKPPDLDVFHTWIELSELLQSAPLKPSIRTIPADSASPVAGIETPTVTDNLQGEIA